MPFRASPHPGSPNSPSCSAIAWYSCWPGLSPWGESGTEPRPLARQRWHATATPLSQLAMPLSQLHIASYHYFTFLEVFTILAILYSFMSWYISVMTAVRPLLRLGGWVCYCNRCMTETMWSLLWLSPDSNGGCFAVAIHSLHRYNWCCYKKAETRLLWINMWSQEAPMKWLWLLWNGWYCYYVATARMLSRGICS